MKKTYMPGNLFLNLISTFFLAASCTFGLDPADITSHNAVLSLTIPNLFESATQANSRAIVPGNGYLYIRMLGGPEGTGAKNFFGPYALSPSSGTTFKTKDIETGSYDGMAILFAAHPVESVKVSVGGAEMTFGNVFSLPDAEFRSAVTADTGDGLTLFDRYLGNVASSTITSPIKVRVNAETKVSATLRPATNMLIQASSGGTLIADAQGTHRGFVKIQGLKTLLAGETGDTVTFKGALRNASDTTASLTVAAAYHADGSLIQGSFVPASSIEKTKSTEFNILWDNEDTCYVYTEFTGAQLILEFRTSATVAGSKIQIAFTGNTNQGNHRAFFAVYDASSVTFDSTEESYVPTGNPVALGMALLDTGGSGSGYACEITTATPKIFAAGTYYVSGFVDKNDNYADITGPQNVPIDHDIMPHFGDYLPSRRMDSITVSAADATFNYDANTFIMCGDNILFVAQNAAGNGLGQRRASPMAIDNAIEEINNQLYSMYMVYFNETVATASTMLISSGITVFLLPAYQSQYTLSLNSVTAGFQVNNSAMLYIKDIILDGSNLSRTSPLVNVGGEFVMDAGSAIKNVDASGSYSGGGVYVSPGGSFIMLGGEISGCKAYYGGGVYASSSSTLPSSFIMNGGNIISCSASAGGGIYTYGDNASAQAVVTINGGTINGCQATSGASILLGGYSTMVFTSGLISNSHMYLGTAHGGGVYLGTNSTLTLAGGVISGTTYESGIADGYGGGVFVDAGGNINLISGSITGCDSLAGDGLYVMNGGLLNGESAAVFMSTSSALLDAIVHDNIGENYLLLDMF